MTALQVRDMPAGLLERLKASAKEQHRSITKQTIVLLEQALEGGGSASSAPVPAETPAERAQRRERLFEAMDDLVDDGWGGEALAEPLDAIAAAHAQLADRRQP